MKVLLLSPPQWGVAMPGLSLPSLTAFLKQHGHKVVQRDLNIEACDLILGGEFLKGRVVERIGERTDILESKDRLEGDELKEYRELCKADMLIQPILQQIEEIMSSSKVGKGAAHARVLGDRDSVGSVSRLISAAYHPASFTPFSFSPDYYRSGRQVKRAVLDEKQNVFRDVFREHFLDSIMAEKADVVGISIMAHPQLIPGVTLASLIREQDSEVHITVGGGLFTAYFDVLIDAKELFDFFSSVIIHEGELPLLRLIEALEGTRGFDTIPNFVYLDGDEVRVNPRREIVDLNALPTPDYDGLPLGGERLPGAAVAIAASRGCYWGRCAFCNETYAADETRERDIALVVEDMARLKEKYGIRLFGFVDNCIQPERLKVLAEKLLGAGLDVGWTAHARTEKRFTPQLCQLLAESGCRTLRWGVESASNRMLKAMRKGTTRKLIESALRNSKEAGIGSYVYILVGFPSDEWRDVRETLNFLVDNRALIGFVSISDFKLYPHSPALAEPERYHITSVQSYKEEIGGSYKYATSGGISQDESPQARLYLERELEKVLPKRVSHWAEHDLLEQYIPGIRSSEAKLCTDSDQTREKRELRLEEVSNWDRAYLELKEGVFHRVLSFDIREGGDGARRECLGVYNLHGHRFFVMGMAVKKFLGMCQQGMSVGEIAAKVSAQRSLPLEQLKRSYVDLVGTLHRGGLVTLHEEEWS